MEAAAVVLENQSGAVRAMVGGWDFDRNKFNRITQAQRQVGSSFKPFVYGAALEAGWTPADTLLDAPTSFIGADGKLSYRPENYYHKHYGIVTLRRALEQSINVPAVKLFELIGGKRAVDFAHRAGIKTPLPTWPSIALGAADLIPMEVASAYATIANQGNHVEPYMIEKISTPDGQVLLPQHFPATYIATTPPVAYVLTHMMEGVVDHGTAYDIHDLPIDIAGKTGTTNDYSDAWFVGFTPHYTILTWIGYDVKKSLGAGMSGAVAALPMWRSIAEDGLATGWLKKGDTFQVPPGVLLQGRRVLLGPPLRQGGPGDQGGVRGRHRAQPAVQLAVVDDRQPPLVPAEGLLHPEGRGEHAEQDQRRPARPARAAADPRPAGYAVHGAAAAVGPSPPRPSSPSPPPALPGRGGRKTKPFTGQLDPTDPSDPSDRSDQKNPFPLPLSR